MNLQSGVPLSRKATILLILGRRNRLPVRGHCGIEIEVVSGWRSSWLCSLIDYVTNHYLVTCCCSAHCSIVILNKRWGGGAKSIWDSYSKCIEARVLPPPRDDIPTDSGLKWLSRIRYKVISFL